MKTIPLIIISVFMCMLGMLFWAYNNEYLVIAVRTKNSRNMLTSLQPYVQTTKKQVTLSYWHHDRWNNEKTEILWTNNMADNAYHLIARWLILLDEEKIIDRRVSLQSALLGPSGQELYVSFDRNILPKDDATFTKLMLIEGLLKTLRDNSIAINKLWFLVHHQSMHDQHLDFSHTWPIGGFIQS